MKKSTLLDIQNFQIALESRLATLDKLEGRAHSIDSEINDDIDDLLTYIEEDISELSRIIDAFETVVKTVADLKSEVLPLEPRRRNSPI